MFRLVGFNFDFDHHNNNPEKRKIIIEPIIDSVSNNSWLSKSMPNELKIDPINKTIKPINIPKIPKANKNLFIGHSHSFWFVQVYRVRSQLAKTSVELEHILAIL